MVAPQTTSGWWVAGVWWAVPLLYIQYERYIGTQTKNKAVGRSLGRAYVVFKGIAGGLEWPFHAVYFVITDGFSWRSSYSRQRSVQENMRT